MVDRKARREYAQLVRQFISGRLTSDEYEDRFGKLQFNKKDRALSEVWEVLDSLCEESLPKKMTEQWRLDHSARRQTAQAVLFLQSDQEYGWPTRLWDGSVFLIAAFCILLIFALNPEVSLLVRSAVSVPVVITWRYHERWQSKRHDRAGDKEAWPFLHQAELESAKRLPRLLNGKARTMS